MDENWNFQWVAAMQHLKQDYQNITPKTTRSNIFLSNVIVLVGDVGEIKIFIGDVAIHKRC